MFSSSNSQNLADYMAYGRTQVNGRMNKQHSLSLEMATWPFDGSALEKIVDEATEIGASRWTT